MFAGLYIPGWWISIFIGIFLLAEAVFSIVYYFDGASLPHVFRVIRVGFGFYLLWSGGTDAIHLAGGPLIWLLPIFLVIMGLSILAGYEVAQVLEARKRKKSSEESQGSG